MAFKDNFRIEKIYFQRVKDDAQILGSWKNDPRRYSREEIVRVAKDACDSILMLYRLIGEAWNDALNHIEKLSAELEALAAKTDAYHDELNEKIDEVNNYLNAQIKNLEIRVENIENSIEDFGGLPSNENAEEGDVLTVGANGVNEWRRVSGLEILTLEYDDTNEVYLLKDPTGSVITTNEIALSWYNKGAIIKVLSTDVDTAFSLNYNKFEEPIETPSPDIYNPFLNMFLYPAFLHDGRPIWSGYGAENNHSIGVIPHVDFYFAPFSASKIYSYDNVADSISLIMDEVADSNGNYDVTGKGGNLFNVLSSLSIPNYSINLEIKKITQRQDNYCTFEVVPYTKYDYLPAVEVAALIDPQDPQPIVNSNGILIYLENGDKIVGYTSRGNGAHTLLMDFYKYIENDVSVPFNFVGPADIDYPLSVTYFKMIGFENRPIFEDPSSATELTIPNSSGLSDEIKLELFEDGEGNVLTAIRFSEKISEEDSAFPNGVVLLDEYTLIIVLQSNNAPTYTGDTIYIVFKANK